MKKIQTLISRALIGSMTLLLGLSMVPAAHAQFPGTNGRIFYGGIDTTSGTSSVLPDGTNIHVHGINYVTNSLRGAVASPNGNTLAYVDVPAGSGTQSDIFTGTVASAITGTNITNTLTDNEDEPYYSSDGTRIVFTRQPTAGGNKEVWVMNSDGTGQVQLTNDIGGSSSYWPVWAPDDSVIYIYSVGNQEIGSIDPTTPNQASATTVYDVNQSIDGMDVDPTGTTIVYSASPGANDALFTVGVNGSGNAQLSTNNAQNYIKPNYSPDGTRIVANTFVTSVTDDTMTIMLADGTGEQDILQDTPGSEYIFVNSHMFWSTSQATYTTIGPDANTPGAPNTTATKVEKNSPTPWILGGLMALVMLGLGGFWVKKELKGKR